MKLLEEARSRLIEARKTLTLNDIEEACGISISWLSRFERGHMPNPGVIQVEKLLDYLRSL